MLLLAISTIAYWAATLADDLSTRRAVRTGAYRERRLTAWLFGARYERWPLRWLLGGLAYLGILIGMGDVAPVGLVSAALVWGWVARRNTRRVA